MKRARKILRIIGLILLVLVIVLAVGGVWFIRRPWPQTTGTISINGLTAAVQVIRDQAGVPHIYAENDHDLFMAQGYVHAQDRLWQMEMDRRIANGELSAAVGKGGLDNDKFMRTLGMRRAAQKEWEMTDAPTRAILEAYSAGVNAFIETHRTALPLEFTILGVTPAPWTPLDTLAWGKVLTFSLGGNYRLELLRARMIANIGLEATQRLLAPYEPDKPIIVPPEAGNYAMVKGASFDILASVDAVLGDPNMVWGSNNWVVHGSRTATGKPMLANDTHLSLGMPSLWYENGLHGGHYNVVGFSFSGVPAVIIGHNDHIAWGVSNLNPDIEDFYIEKVDDKKHPTKYQYQDQWHDLQIITETIDIKGAPSEPIMVRSTRHGPLLNDVFTFEGDDAMALHWTVIDGTALFGAVARLDQARNWDEFRQALSGWEAPSQNFVYADVDGNIGYQATGKIPIRAKSGLGLVPAIGWDGASEWVDYIPFDKLPFSLNPPQGFIGTANNKVVTDSYPYLIANEWDIGYRAKRISDLLAANSHVTLDDMATIQSDTYSLPAETLRPYLLAITPQNDEQRRALDVVKSWNLRYDLDQVGGSIYQVWYWFLLQNTLKDDLGDALADRYLAGNYERHGTFQLPLMTKMMSDPNEKWFDDKTTPQVETRDDIILKSLSDALKWLNEHYGSDSTKWSWGNLHVLTLPEQPFGASALARFFNGPNVPARGDNFTIDSGSFRYSNPFTMVHGSSQRLLVDLSNVANARGIITTGQSGQLFHPHRQDQVAMWQNVEYHPMLFDRAQIDAQAEATLTLTP